MSWLDMSLPFRVPERRNRPPEGYEDPVAQDRKCVARFHEYSSRQLQCWRLAGDGSNGPLHPSLRWGGASSSCERTAYATNLAEST